MASIHVVPRPMKGGGERFHVRMSGGRYDPLVHLGSFPSRQIAESAASRARLMIEEGVVPTRETIAAHRVTPSRVTLQQAYDAWIASRVDLTDSTRQTYAALARHALRAFKGRDVRSITRDDVQAFLGQLAADSIEPRTIPKYRRVLGQVLDHAGVDPNPTRDRLLRNPRAEEAAFRLPTPSELELLYPALRRDVRNAVLLLEHTGLRVSEAAALEHSDLDRRRRRFRVSKAKTRAGIRWVDDLPEYPDRLVALLDQPKSTSRYVLGGLSSGAIAAALMRGCDRAEVPHFSPHDFRHLHISRLMFAGWDPVMVAARVGHSRPATTLNVYSHVIPPD